MEVLDDIVAEHVLHHDATSPKPKNESPVSFKQVAHLFQAAFPDANIPLFDLIAEGDRVVARWGLRGTHQGTFMDFPPTEKPVSVNGIIIYRLVDQKIVEYWKTFDTRWVLQQLDTI